MPKKKPETLRDLGGGMPDEIGAGRLPSGSGPIRSPFTSDGNMSPAPMPYRKEKGGGKMPKGKPKGKK